MLSLELFLQHLLDPSDSSLLGKRMARSLPEHRLHLLRDLITAHQQVLRILFFARQMGLSGYYQAVLSLQRKRSLK